MTQIVADKKLLSLALAHGKAAFAENCAPCHGSGGQGGKGYRNLTNEDWLWGGTLDDIQTTITHGIRADDDKDTRASAMPAFGKDGILKPEEIQRGRQLRAHAEQARAGSRASTSPPARRSSPTIARRATATTARATCDGLGQPHRRLAALRVGL